MSSLCVRILLGNSLKHRPSQGTLGRGGFPNMSNPIIKAEWLVYLRAQGLHPADFGATTWADVLPSAERRATALPAKRRFFWTARFASAASTAHFARATKAIQANASGFAVPTYANFNCWQGRVWTPDAGSTQNINKTDENAAEIGNDWFEPTATPQLLKACPCPRCVRWQAMCGQAETDSS